MGKYWPLGKILCKASNSYHGINYISMKLKSIFFVVGPDGKIWRESVRIAIEKHIDNHTCWQVWQCFQRADFKIELDQVLKV
jgi:hypothetical protein